jgi:hypothetical protein
VSFESLRLSLASPAELKSAVAGGAAERGFRIQPRDRSALAAGQRSLLAALKFEKARPALHARDPLASGERERDRLRAFEGESRALQWDASPTADIYRIYRHNARERPFGRGLGVGHGLTAIVDHQKRWVRSALTGRFSGQVSAALNS